MSERWHSLIAERPSSAILAVGAEGPRTYGELVRDVLATSRALGDRDPSDVVLLCDDRYRFAVGLLGAWEASRRVVLPPSSTPSARTDFIAQESVRTVVHDGAVERGLDLRALLSGERGVVGGQLRPIDAAREVMVLHTSATTGSGSVWPKSARQLFAEVEMIVLRLGVTSEDRILATVPVHHIYGLLFGVLLPLRAGASLVREGEMFPAPLLACLRAHEPRILVSTPAHLAALAQTGAPPPTRLAKIVSSGAPLARDIGHALSERFGVEVIEVLGSTETGGIAMRRGDQDEPWAPFPGVTVRSADDGRLFVVSPFLAADAVEWASADRGEVLSDGRFHHHGREDGIVKVGGKRIDLADVERAALACSGVSESAALAVDVDSLRGREIWLAVVARDHEPTAFRRELAARLDPMALPRRVRVVGSLPRGATGKVSRSALRALFEEPPPASIGTGFEVDALARGPGDEAPRRFRVRVRDGAPYFEGHFPGHPVLPGIAQLCELVLPVTGDTWPALGSPAGFRRLKFGRVIRPGADLVLELVRLADAKRVDFRLSDSQGQLCSSGTIDFGARGNGG